jgi:hypothetical protein
MEWIRLCKIRHRSKLEELLESYISQSQIVPKGSYQICERESVPREVRKALTQAVRQGEAWSCRAHGLHTWLFTCRESRPLSRERGAPVLLVSLYGDHGELRDCGAWMPDPHGKWCRSAN